MHPHRSLILLAALILGCQSPVPPSAPAPTGAARRSTDPAARLPAKVAPAGAATPAPALDVTRRLGPTETLQAVTLVGKVKLISDRGLGIISNNTGSLVSNNGGGVISSNGGSYRLTAAPAEALLTEARIEVIDAEGQVLAGPDGKPISTVSDGQGGYRLEARLPGENLVLRVRLAGGGELLAMLALANDQAPATLDIDTATSFSAAYVLDRFVKGSRQIFDKLPRAEAEALTEAMAAAQAQLDAPPSYDRSAQVAAAQALRTQAPQLDAQLETIKVLLIGQADLGNGLAADQVTLTTPIAITGDAAGQLYIAESVVGRVRKVGKDGTISTFASDFESIFDMTANGQDLIVTDRFGHTLRRVAPDGTVTTIAGTGLRGNGTATGNPLRADLSHLYQAAVGPDGAIHFAQNVPRLFTLGTDGRLSAIDAPADWRFVKGVAVGPDGTLAALETVRGELAFKPPGQPWRVVARELGTESRSRLAWAPSGGVYLSEPGQHRVVEIAPDGTITPIAGSGEAGASGDGGPATAAKLSYPAGIWRSPAGALYIADYGNGLVRVVENGRIRTVAGTTGQAQQGDAQAIALNGPLGLALDPEGRLTIAEGGSGTIKRLDGGQLSIIAGTTKGYSGDGGPATQAQLESVAAIAYDPTGALWVLCEQMERVRRIDADGTIQTWLTDVPKGWLTAIAIDPSGKPVFSDSERHVIRRIEGENSAPVIVGKDQTMGDTGDGGPASEASLFFPFGLAYAPDGSLYLSDAGNCRVRKVDPDGKITTVAGVGHEAIRAGAASYDPARDTGVVATDAVLIGPGPLAFDGEGNLYIAEMGTLNLRLSRVDPAMLEGLPTVPPRIRKLTPDGKLHTVAGPGGKIFKDAADAIGLPMGILIDRQGRLVVSDALKNQLRIVPKGQY